MRAPPAGVSAATIAWILAALSFAMGGIGVGAWWLGMPGRLLWPPLVVVLVLHFPFVQYAWRAVRVLRRLSPELDGSQG